MGKEVASLVPDLTWPSGLQLGVQETGCGHYFCSPADSITFGYTGGDGIHYAILTDFGRVVNLEEAPIICVSPMDFGNCVWLVARNLRDFFSIQFSEHVTLLLNYFESKESYLEALRRDNADQEDPYFDKKEWLRQKKVVRTLASERFNLPLIENPYEYIEELRSERLAQVALRTVNRLGVLPDPSSSSNCPFVGHPWQNDEIPYDIATLLPDFLASASKEAKFAFIRDYQEQFITDSDALQLLCKELRNLNLPWTAERLKISMNQ